MDSVQETSASIPSTQYDVQQGDTVLQLLTPEGERVPNAELDVWLEDIDQDAMIKLYQDMVVARRIDVEATALQRQGHLALWPPFQGQEAAQVGSAHALNSDDFVFPSYRENAVAYVRGVNMTDMLRVWRGNAHGGWNPREVHIAPTQVIIGAQSLHAAGYAMGVKLDGGTQVAIAYYGDGATSQGDVHEAMVFAASYGAPAIFFCQNNHWAISEPVGLQSHTPLAARGEGVGLASYRIDGNDVLVSLAVTRMAAASAREGGGPSFIEAITYRIGPHTTADDPTRYRDANEVEEWKGKDPIARLEKYLIAQGVDADELRAGAQAEADTVAADLRKGVTNLTDPEPMEVFDNVYVEPHPVLEEQRENYREYLESFTTAEGTR